ncbi:MAG: HU family DNA-binding protein [Oscillospiraceae bacterium]|nr:HU family DNA-binding protein [Oscillospiraceae bacterium]MDD6085068.1 HU family DNA-binding protein [Oscillospiraceae bacterium]MDY3258010.1 HU family DNA-binding protein [Ruminococcus callidus]
MTKTDLVSMIAERGGYTNKDAEKALSAVIGSITDALTSGEKVSLVGFGTFEVRDKAERKGVNPHTHEEIIVPARKSPAFKAGKALKEAVNK